MPGIAPPLPPADPTSNGGALQPLQDLLQDMGRLLAAAPPPDVFYAGFLQRILAATGTEAGAVWGRDAQGAFRLEHQLGREAVGPEANPDAAAQHAGVLQAAAERKGLSNPLGLAVSPRIARPACRA
jgi:hypothetical protein